MSPVFVLCNVPAAHLANGSPARYFGALSAIFRTERKGRGPSTVTVTSRRIWERTGESMVLKFGLFCCLKSGNATQTDAGEAVRGRLARQRRELKTRGARG